MCFSLVSMLDFMGQNLTSLKSRLSKLQSWHQNFSCLVGPNEHFYTRCLLSARTSHGTTFAPRLYMAGNRSRFSKHLMAGSPIFSVNFTNRKNSAVLNYHDPYRDPDRHPDQTSRFCGISISCFCWSRVFGCSLLFSVQGMA